MFSKEGSILTLKGSDGLVAVDKYCAGLTGPQVAVPNKLIDCQ